MDDAPAILQRVMREVIEAAQSGSPMPSYDPFSEEWYWGKLLDKKPFRSIFATQGGKQPLIDGPDKNLSQTPREQCELQGLVTEGVERPGPGQEVVLQGLKGAAELNGQHGRVLPLTGRGAPAAPTSAGRLPVRLVGGREVACRPENLRSAHSGACLAAGSTAPAAAAPSSPASTASPPQSAPLPEPKGPLADLIRADVLKGSIPPLLKKEHLRSAGLPDHKIKCVACGRYKEQFIALKRTIPLSPTPVPHAVKLECIDCLIRAAEAAGVRPTAKAVERFVNGRMMGSVEACGMLTGAPRETWGGIHGCGALY